MSLPREEQARRAIEAAARESYGRLVAYLSARTRDVAGAEDALSEALIAALTTWPRDGVPRNPDAWLLTAARHRMIDQSRHQRVHSDSAATLEIILTGSADHAGLGHIPDERLKLLFVCAHPAIDSQIHTPLMLQAVLGLNGEEIARAFVVSPSAMSQRLVRAKTKIRQAGVAFDVPDRNELPQRLQAVLDAIYAAYGSGWEGAVGSASESHGLAEEAIWLARVLRDLMPEDPEVRGLLALMLHCEARRSARRSSHGGFVPLTEQDTRLWNIAMIQEAEKELAQASRASRPGRFQIEAAIQSVHAERLRTGRTDWQAIAAFYDLLVRLSPTLGARVGQAAAVCEVGRAITALSLLDEIETASVVAYQPYWAVRAHVLGVLNRHTDAIPAFDRAIGLSDDEAVRQFLLRRRSASRSGKHG